MFSRVKSALNSMAHRLAGKMRRAEMAAENAKLIEAKRQQESG